ncbi:hypothetical protein VC83_04859 [Pseudogymnoascus destructans]|nr:uncharacterized protein VC83_04859 [Pseudogymnoascus destructans]OAF57580.1 hypothetical protein VC83_04859 [Pseudogymnoascus destructans]
MESIPNSRATSAHVARLDRTLKDLQRKLEEQEEVLKKLRAAGKPIQEEPDSNKDIRLLQISKIKSAFDALTPVEPYTPLPDSPLPSLLALRTTHITTSEAKSALSITKHDLSQVEQLLQKEAADLEDGRLIENALQTRISALETAIEKHVQKPKAQVAKDMMRGLKNKKARYDMGTVTLVKSFNEFIDDHLAVMLAAEELGGPVVGELLDIDETNLEAGFNAQGKARKLKGPLSEIGRQQRIDEIWKQQPEQQRRAQEPWNETTAAATEMRELTEQLLNNLVEADGRMNGGYMELDRESGAARFLVRSRVAQFHPRDARCLRLIDFGKDLVS